MLENLVNLIEYAFNENTLALAGIMLIFYILRFIITGPIPYYLIYKRGWFKSKRVSDKGPSLVHLKKDYVWSFKSIPMFVLAIVLLVPLYRMGYTQLYFDINEQSWWMYLAVPIGMYVIYDINFYSLHSLMHKKWFFKKFHYAHHTAHPVSPVSGWSFHPVEAFLSRVPFITICAMILPIHPLSFLIFIIILSFFNMMGHSGLEFRPNAYKNWLMVSSTYHYDHHKKTHPNVKSFFNFWWNYRDTD